MLKMRNYLGILTFFVVAAPGVNGQFTPVTAKVTQTVAHARLPQGGAHEFHQ